jgi:hypothetical protein
MGARDLRPPDTQVLDIPCPALPACLPTCCCLYRLQLGTVMSLSYSSVHTVFVYCIRILYLYTVFVYCIRILYLYTVFVYCIRILYLYTVFVYCICILYSYTVFVYRICILYSYTVFVYRICIPCLYTVFVPFYSVRCVLLTNPSSLFFFLPVYYVCRLLSSASPLRGLSTIGSSLQGLMLIPVQEYKKKGQYQQCEECR